MVKPFKKFRGRKAPQRKNKRRGGGGSIQGRRIRTSADPKSTNEVPWSRVILSFKSTTANVYYHDLISILRSQLYLQENQIIAFRIHSIKVWCDVDPLREFKVAIYSGTTSENQVLSVQADCPGKNHYAHIGFLFPLLDRSYEYTSVYLKPDDTLSLLDISQDNTFIQISVSWRPYYVAVGHVNRETFVLS